MASIYDVKPQFQNLLRPVCRRLFAAGVTANAVTVSAVLLSAAAGAAVLLFPRSVVPLLALPVVLFVRMGLNAIDGMLAREFGQKSRLGAVLNEVGDVVSDVAIVLPLAVAFPPAAVVGFVIAGLLAEYAGVVALQVGSDRRYDGPMGKSDRAFLVGALALAFGLGLINAAVAGSVLWIGAGLALLSTVRRCRAALSSGSVPPDPRSGERPDGDAAERRAAEQNATTETL